MMTKEKEMEIERTLENNAVYIRDQIDDTVTLCLYSSTEGDDMIFTDRCGNLRSYRKATYGTEWVAYQVEFRELIKWDDVAEPIAKAFHAEYAGDEILTLTEEQADRIANLLESLGFDYAITGYYDPKEDARDGIDDNYTGKWYVSVD